MSEPRIRLSLASATVLDDHLHGEPVYEDKLRAAKAELGRAVARLEWTPAARRSGKAAVTRAFPKPDPADRKARKRSAEEEHKERMRVIRAGLVARSTLANGQPLCERCRLRLMADPHHLFGRGKGRPLESERNCVGLCRPCHELMQGPQTPFVAAESWRWAGQHLEELGFGEEAAMCWARMRKVQVRAEVTRAGEALRGR